MSAATFHQGYGQLLLQVMRDRVARGMLVRVTVLAAAAAVGLPWLFSGVLHLPGPARLFAVLAGVGVIVLWYGTYVRSAVRQNQPEYACLVPGLRRRLMTLTAALHVCSSVLTAGMIAAVYGHFGYAVASACLFFSYVLLVQRYTLLFILPSVLIFASASLGHPLARWVGNAATAMGEPAISGIGLLTATALWTWSLLKVFPRGGDRHWAWQRRLTVCIGRLRGVAPADYTANVKPWVWRVGNGMRSPYLAALRRDSRRATHAPSPVRMMMHALGPETHAGGSMAYALGLTLLSLLALALGAPGSTVGNLAHTSLPPMFILMAPLIYTTAVVQAIGRNATEQRLYLLAPGAPSPALLNRVLARTLLGRYLLVWLVAAAGALLVDTCSGDAVAAAHGATVTLAALLVLLPATLLRDYAAMRPASSHNGMIGWTLFVISGWLLATLADRKLFDVPWMALGAVVAACGLLALGLCWRRMMAMPPALPAGRLAA
ncbi:hypothetical protein [Duganella hordei]|uniref:hypothetical protein n=1 Tax=Duganella hordei TaxID=2865934 RepID=UPI0030E7CB7B